MGACVQCGPAGQYVIDDQYVPAGEFFWRFDGKTVAQIRKSFVVGAMHLRAGMPAFAEAGRVDREAPPVAEGAGDFFALVVSAGEAAPPMDRYGDDQIDVARPALAFDIGGEEGGEIVVDPRLSPVLGFV